MTYRKRKNQALKELSITFCDAIGNCFDLLLCKFIDFKFENVNWWIQLLTKILYNLHIHLIAENNKDELSSLSFFLLI